jgi:hypothetical protein
LLNGLGRNVAASGKACQDISEHIPLLKHHTNKPISILVRE